MEKRITTIYIPIDLLEYVRVNNLNLSKFITEALYEHSGKRDETLFNLNNLEEEIKQKKAELAIKTAIFEEKKAEIEQKKIKKEQELAEIERKKKECKNCGSQLLDRELGKYAGYCKSCYWGKGYKEVLKQENA